VPWSMNVAAATMRSTLCRRGAQADHFAVDFDAVMKKPSFLTLLY
jgi:hypothetical protein